MMIIDLYYSFLDYVLLYFMFKINKLINYTCLIYMEEEPKFISGSKSNALCTI